VRDALPGSRLRNTGKSRGTDPRGEKHLSQAAESLRGLLDDPKVPRGVRESLSSDYGQVRAMLEKLEHGELFVAAFGRVGVGKSSLLNALVGREAFSVSPLHGETRAVAHAHWESFDAGRVRLIDTPGIDEIDGATRERMAHEVAGRADLVIFVAEGDLTRTELAALEQVTAERRPVVIALNKADRYTPDELDSILERIAERTTDLVKREHVVPVSANPAPVTRLESDASGAETEARVPREPDVAALSAVLWDVLEREGKTLAALNASLFAGRLSDEVARRVAAARRDVAEKVIRTWCVGKGVAVALNPVPVADLLAAGAIDVALVVHLGRVYGLPVTRREAGRLIGTLTAELALLMGTVWGLNLVSAALKGLTAGFSVAITATLQGAAAYYATYVVGRAAERYFVNGKSWGPGGPKAVVQSILRSVDKGSVLAQGQRDITDTLAWRRT